MEAELLKPINKDKTIDFIIGLPGNQPGKFEIEFDQDYGLSRKDIIVGPLGIHLKVIKTYPFNLYRRIRFALGFKIKSSRCVIVKKMQHESKR